MAIKITADMIGAEAIQKKLIELGAKANKIQDPILQESAGPMEKSMIAKAPVRTGKGRGSIKIGKVKTEKGRRVITVGIHSEDHKDGLHMYYQEFGTSRHKAQPFIRPAYEEEKKNFLYRLKNGLKGGLGL